MNNLERMQVSHRTKKLFSYEADVLFIDRCNIVTLQLLHVLTQIARLDQLLHYVKVTFVVENFVSVNDVLVIYFFENQKFIHHPFFTNFAFTHQCFGYYFNCAIYTEFDMDRVVNTSK